MYINRCSPHYPSCTCSRNTCQLQCSPCVTQSPNCLLASLKPCCPPNYKHCQHFCAPSKCIPQIRNPKNFIQKQTFFANDFKLTPFCNHESIPKISNFLHTNYPSSVDFSPIILPAPLIKPIKPSTQRIHTRTISKQFEEIKYIKSVEQLKDKVFSSKINNTEIQTRNKRELKTAENVFSADKNEKINFFSEKSSISQEEFLNKTKLKRKDDKNMQEVLIKTQILQQPKNAAATQRTPRSRTPRSHGRNVERELKPNIKNVNSEISNRKEVVKNVIKSNKAKKRKQTHSIEENSFFSENSSVSPEESLKKTKPKKRDDNKTPPSLIKAVLLPKSRSLKPRRHVLSAKYVSNDVERGFIPNLKDITSVSQEEFVKKTKLKKKDDNNTPPSLIKTQILQQPKNVATTQLTPRSRKAKSHVLSAKYISNDAERGLKPNLKSVESSRKEVEKKGIKSNKPKKRKQTHSIEEISFDSEKSSVRQEESFEKTKLKKGDDNNRPPSLIKTQMLQPQKNEAVPLPKSRSLRPRRHVLSAKYVSSDYERGLIPNLKDITSEKEVEKKVVSNKPKKRKESHSIEEISFDSKKSSVSQEEPFEKTKLKKGDDYNTPPSLIKTKILQPKRNEVSSSRDPRSRRSRRPVLSAKYSLHVVERGLKENLKGFTPEISKRKEIEKKVSSKKRKYLMETGKIEPIKHGTGGFATPHNSGGTTLPKIIKKIHRPVQNEYNSKFINGQETKPDTSAFLSSHRLDRYNVRMPEKYFNIGFPEESKPNFKPKYLGDFRTMPGSTECLLLPKAQITRFSIQEIKTPKESEHYFKPYIPFYNQRSYPIIGPSICFASYCKPTCTIPKYPCVPCQLSFSPYLRYKC